VTEYTPNFNGYAHMVEGSLVMTTYGVREYYSDAVEQDPEMMGGFDRWFAPYKEALDVVQRVQWLGDILNGHDRWLADHDKEVLDKAVERMYASAANDESDFRSLKAAVRGEGE